MFSLPGQSKQSGPAPLPQPFHGKSKPSQPAEQAAAGKVLEDSIARREARRRPARGRRAKELAELYRLLAMNSLVQCDFDGALMQAQRAYDLAECLRGPLAPPVVGPLVLRSELAGLAGRAVESKATAEQAYAVTSRNRLDPQISAGVYLRGAALAFNADELPDARAAAGEAAGLSAGLDPPVHLGAIGLLARIKWVGNLRDEALDLLRDAAATGGDTSATDRDTRDYFTALSLGSAKFALSRNQVEPAADALWTVAAIELVSQGRLAPEIQETVNRVLTSRPLDTVSAARASETTGPRSGELADLIRHFEV